MTRAIFFLDRINILRFVSWYLTAEEGRVIHDRGRRVVSDNACVSLSTIYYTLTLSRGDFGLSEPKADASGVVSLRLFTLLTKTFYWKKTASKEALALRLMIWMYLCVRKKEKTSLIIWGNFINEFEHLVWTAVPDGNCFIILKKGDWSPVWILFVGPRLNTKILAAVPVLACRTWQKMNYPISHINDVNSYCLLIRLTSNISKKCQFFLT